MDLCITPCSLNTYIYIVLISYLIYYIFNGKILIELSENAGTLELCNILPRLNASKYYFITKYYDVLYYYFVVLK